METSLKDAWALSSLFFIPAPTLLLWTYFFLKKPKDTPELYLIGSAIGGILSLALWVAVAPDKPAFELVYVIVSLYITGIAMTPRSSSTKPTKAKPTRPPKPVKPIAKKASVRKIKKLEKQAQKLWQKYPTKDEETFWDAYEAIVKKDA